MGSDWVIIRYMGRCDLCSYYRAILIVQACRHGDTDMICLTFYVRGNHLFFSFYCEINALLSAHWEANLCFVKLIPGSRSSRIVHDKYYKECDVDLGM